MVGKPRVDLTGVRSGFLVAKKYLGCGKWLCKCDCGEEKAISGSSIKRGKTKSCGCMSNRLKSESKKKHGTITHGGRRPRAYVAWKSMRRKCSNPKDESYKAHGGCGIKVCDEWQEFEPFYEWSLENGYDENAPAGCLFFERINPGDDFEPRNCRWLITSEDERRHTSSTHAVPVEMCDENGDLVIGFPTLKLASEFTGISMTGIRSVCTGELRHAHGTFWRFAEPVTDYPVPDTALKDEIMKLVNEHTDFDEELLDLPGEEWRPVVGFESEYEVSNRGRVRSTVYQSARNGISRKMLLKQNVNSNGYMQVYLRTPGRSVSRRVHRLVAEAFIPNPDNLPVVDHIDFNRTNNDIDNLQWLTYGENIRRSRHRMRGRRPAKTNSGEPYIHETAYGTYELTISKRHIGTFKSIGDAVEKRDEILAREGFSL